MAKKEFNRVRNQKRWDIKIDGRVYEQLKVIKGVVEKARSKNYSMSEVVGLLCDWSAEEVNRIRNLSRQLDAATTRKAPQKVFH